MSEKKKTCKDCNNVYCSLYNTDFEACKRIDDFDENVLNQMEQMEQMEQ